MITETFAVAAFGGIVTVVVAWLRRRRQPTSADLVLSPASTIPPDVAVALPDTLATLRQQLKDARTEIRHLKDLPTRIGDMERKLHIMEAREEMRARDIARLDGQVEKMREAAALVQRELGGLNVAIDKALAGDAE